MNNICQWNQNYYGLGCHQMVELEGGRVEVLRRAKPMLEPHW